MSEELQDIDNQNNNEEILQAEEVNSTAQSKYVLPANLDESTLHHLPGMYYTWYLDYASYVILDRAIPHINDGLKPVQRRILHSMREKEDGRYNKVANLVGHTMQYHPHGDAAITDALVQLGQKNLLIDTQGNWGNILTGDEAAAGRYIEARLTKFALETTFNPKTTEYKPSYDGRNKEPINLPVKFPLLLAHGAEGIAVGLSTKILPHNFNEIIDASISYLNGKKFELYPDFPTGGSIDISRYNDGERGGRLKNRAKIIKSADNKTLIVTEIPYGITTEILKDDIVKASEQGKINIKKIDDNTAENVEILILLDNRANADKTIDALYAFTKCEVSYAPNCCVIEERKPIFTSVSSVLKKNTDNTLELLKKELDIQKDELTEQLFFISLEQIFIDEQIYKDKEFENAKSTDEAVKHIDRRIEPYKADFVRQVKKDDLLKLLEIRMARILKFNTEKAEENIANLRKKIEETENKLAHIVEHTIEWFEYLKKTYGKNFPRKTEIRNFENIVVTNVVEANAKLYVNKSEGYIGTNLKKDDNIEFVSNCSDIDDIIIFFKNGKYKVVKVSEKQFVGENIEHVAVYIRNDVRTIFNAIYRDGKNGVYYVKRFAVSGVTRDKEYDVTMGKPDSKLMYFSANPNGEAERVKIQLKPTSRRIKKMSWELNFSDITIKGRASRGNLVTKFPISKIIFKEGGVSTLGGTHIWLDKDILRLNTEERGDYLGEFFADDTLLVINKNGDYYTTNFDLNNHFDEDYLKIEKFEATKIWSVALYDAEQKFYYIKRFQFEPNTKRTSFIGEDPNSKLVIISENKFPCFKVSFGGKDVKKEQLIIDVEQFIGEKSFKAKGKRISTYNIAKIVELKPIRQHETEIENTEINQIEITEVNKVDKKNEILENNEKKNDEPSKPVLIYDKDNPTGEEGQLSLF